MPHATARAVGDYGERIAERYLTDRGLVVLARNWRCSMGEIDIVARDGRCLVVCEVKTRRSDAFGSPLTGITHAKLARLRRLVGAWLAEGPGAGPIDDVRIDVVAVTRPRTGPATVEHLIGVG